VRRGVIRQAMELVGREGKCCVLGLSCTPECPLPVQDPANAEPGHPPGRRRCTMRLHQPRLACNCERLFHTLTTAAMMLDWCGAAANAEPGHSSGTRRCMRRHSGTTRRSARCSWRKEPTSRPGASAGEPRPPCTSAIHIQRCRLSLALDSNLAHLVVGAVRQGGGGQASQGVCWAGGQVLRTGPVLRARIPTTCPGSCEC